MFPQPRSVVALVISVGEESLAEKFVSKDAGLQ
jgi:hypothetical protein